MRIQPQFMIGTETFGSLAAMVAAGVARARRALT